MKNLKKVNVVVTNKLNQEYACMIGTEIDFSVLGSSIFASKNGIDIGSIMHDSDELKKLEGYVSSEYIYDKVPDSFSGTVTGIINGTSVKPMLFVEIEIKEEVPETEASETVAEVSEKENASVTDISETKTFSTKESIPDYDLLRSVEPAKKYVEIYVIKATKINVGQPLIFKAHQIPACDNIVFMEVYDVYERKLVANIVDKRYKDNEFRFSSTELTDKNKEFTGLVSEFNGTVKVGATNIELNSFMVEIPDVLPETEYVKEFELVSVKEPKAKIPVSAFVTVIGCVNDVEVPIGATVYIQKYDKAFNFYRAIYDGKDIGYIAYEKEKLRRSIAAENISYEWGDNFIGEVTDKLSSVKGAICKDLYVNIKQINIKDEDFPQVKEVASVAVNPYINGPRIRVGETVMLQKTKDTSKRIDVIYNNIIIGTVANDIDTMPDYCVKLPVAYDKLINTYEPIPCYVFDSIITDVFGNNILVVQFPYSIAEQMETIDEIAETTNETEVQETPQKEETLVQKYLRIEEEMATCAGTISDVDEMAEAFKKELYKKYDVSNLQQKLDNLTKEKNKNMGIMLYYLFQYIAEDLQHKECRDMLNKKLKDMICIDEYSNSKYKKITNEVLTVRSIREKEKDYFMLQQTMGAVKVLGESGPAIPASVSFTDLYNLVNEIKEKDAEMTRQEIEKKEHAEKAKRYAEFMKLKAEFEPENGEAYVPPVTEETEISTEDNIPATEEAEPEKETEEPVVENIKEAIKEKAKSVVNSKAGKAVKKFIDCDVKALGKK